MAQTVQFHREPLVRMLEGGWTEAWIVSPEIDSGAVALLLPHLRRPGARVRVLTHITPARTAEGKVDLEALLMLKALPGCEVRSLPDLAACGYAVGPGGPALVTGAPLTLAGIDGSSAYGALLPDSSGAVADFERWWSISRSYREGEWAELIVAASQRLEAHTLGEEIARVGAFVRVSVHGTRRTRRLDPREFGAPDTDWGRAVRPVEVALYKLDDVIRAKEELESVLAEHGVEWNGYYLVPRHFLECDWPRLFAARQRQLQERLRSAEGQAVLKTQLAQARRELEAFFGELYLRVDADGMEAARWVEVQTTRVLAETVTGSILQDSGLEYRVLTIIPEDNRSVEEISQIIRDSRLRSVQLTFNL